MDKDILIALVSEQQTPDTSKKEGLIILLHGPPGVGKTVTVRAVAEMMHAPLRMLHPSNLGKEAAETSGKLYNFFETAQRWNAIALIDNANVFLKTRSLADLERNTVVAIFLSSLERYTGTLFLTTNRVSRVEAFDEAFKSRIRLSLYFESLDMLSRKIVWKNHIRSLDIAGEEDELLGHLDELAEYSLDGRQIGSVFLNAKQLAKYRGTNLRWEDVESAIKTISNFENHLKSLKGQGF